MVALGLTMTFKSVCLQEKMLVEYDNAKVLVTDMKIETIKEIIPILEQVTRINQPLIIIAEDVTGVLPGDPLTLLNLCAKPYWMENHLCVLVKGGLLQPLLLTVSHVCGCGR